MGLGDFADGAYRIGNGPRRSPMQPRRAHSLPARLCRQRYDLGLDDCSGHRSPEQISATTFDVPAMDASPDSGTMTRASAASSSSASGLQARGSFGERGTSATHGPGPMDFIAVDEPEMNRKAATALARIVRALRVQLRKEAA